MAFFKSFAVFTCVTAAAFANETDLTPEEAKALELFRPSVISLISQDFMKSDAYLMRYLRAEKLNFEKAKQRLERTLAWRKAENIDNIMSEDFSQIEKCMPIYWIGQDREGRPIIFHSFGTWDIRRCVLAGHFDKMLRYVTARKFDMGERLVFNSTDPSGKKVAKIQVVTDLNNFNLRQGACLRCVPFISGLTSNYDKYFVGLVYKVNILNVNQVFENMLVIIRSVLTPENADILRVYGHDRSKWTAALARDMDTNLLPITLGGKLRLKS